MIKDTIVIPTVAGYSVKLSEIVVLYKLLATIVPQKLALNSSSV